MALLVTRVDEEMATAIDDLVAQGIYPNRSAVVQAALKELLRERRRRHEIEMYTRFPQTEDELSGIERETREMIEEEPW